MLSFLLFLAYGDIPRIELKLGYGEYLISELSIVQLMNKSYLNYQLSAIFLNNEDFQNVPRKVTGGFDNIFSVVKPWRPPTVLKCIVFRNTGEKEIMAIVDGANESYNTIDMEIINKISTIVFVSSTEFNYKFKNTTKCNFMIGPDSDKTEVTDDFDIGNQKLFFLQCKPSIIHYKAEKINKSQETEGYVVDYKDYYNHAIIGVEGYEFHEGLRLPNSGKYELVIGNESQTIYLSKDSNKKFLVVSHQNKNVLIQDQQTNQWSDFPNISLMNGQLVVKSNSGSVQSLKLVIIEGDYSNYSTIDVVLNIEENKQLVGKINGDDHLRILTVFASWDPISFKQYWTYDCEPGNDFPVSNLYTKYPIDPFGTFQGVTTITFDFNPQNQMDFSVYDFNITSEVSEDLNRGIFHFGNKPVINEDPDYQKFNYTYCSQPKSFHYNLNTSSPTQLVVFNFLYDDV